MRPRVSFENQATSPNTSVRRNIFGTPARSGYTSNFLTPNPGYPLSRCSESPEAKQQIECPIDKATGEEIFEWRDTVVKKIQQETGSQRSHWDYVRWNEAQMHSNAETLPTEGMKLRWTGNKRFADDNFACSVLSYSAGVKEAQQSEVDIHLRHIFYTNRASANLPLGNFALALSDANKALEYRPGYVRAHIRKALALLGLQQLDNAAQAIFCCAQTCTLKTDEWTYVTSILHKAIPVTESIENTVALLSDSRLECVSQYLISTLYHLLTLICKEDIDPMTLFIKPRDTLSEVSDCGGSEFNCSDRADTVTITKEILKVLGNGIETASECTSKQLSSCSDGEGMNSFRGRLLLLSQCDGIPVVRYWLSSKSNSAVKIASILLQIVDMFLPVSEVKHLTQKEQNKSLTKHELYRPPPPEMLTDWDEGDICQVLVGKEWIRGRVANVLRSGSFDVFINDLNNIRNVTAAELRMEVSELDEGIENKYQSVEGDAHKHSHELHLDFRDWRECEDRLGNTFYFNPKTGRSVRRLEDALIDEKQPEKSVPTESIATARSELSDLESESAAEEDNEEVINALKSGTWVMVRHLRTGHKQYFEPQTKATTTNLALELSLRKLTPKLTIDGKFTNELTEASHPPPPPQQEEEEEESDQTSDFGRTYPREEFPDEMTHVIPDIPINQELRIYEEDDADDADEFNDANRRNRTENVTYEESEEEIRENIDDVSHRVSMSPYAKLLDRNPHLKSPIVFSWDSPVDVEKMSLDKITPPSALRPALRKPPPPPRQQFVEAIAASSYSGSDIEVMWGSREPTVPQKEVNLSKASLSELQQVARDRGIEDFGGRLMLIQRILNDGDPNFKKPLSETERRDQMKVEIAAQVPRKLIELQAQKEAAILTGNDDEVVLLESQIVNFKLKAADGRDDSLTTQSRSNMLVDESYSPMSPLSVDEELDSIAKPRDTPTTTPNRSSRDAELIVSPLLESLSKAAEYFPTPAKREDDEGGDEVRIEEQKEELEKAIEFENNNPFPFPFPSNEEEEVVQRDVSPSTLSYSPGRSESSLAVNQLFGRKNDSVRRDPPPPPISGFQIGGPMGIRRVSQPSVVGSDVRSSTLRSLNEIRQGAASVDDFIDKMSERSRSIFSTQSETG